MRRNDRGEAGTGEAGTDNPSPITRSIELVALLILDAVGVLFVARLVADGVYPLAGALLLIVAAVNIVFLRPALSPIRWLTPGLAMAALFALYPVFFTIYTSFTNYGAGHILTREQVIRQLESRRFTPEDAARLAWHLYEREPGDWILLLESYGTRPAGESVERDITDPPRFYLATPESIESFDQPDEELYEPPEEINGYTLVPPAATLQRLTRLEGRRFGDPEAPFEIRSSSLAIQVQQRFVYDPDSETLTDRRESVEYRPDDSIGYFVDGDGHRLVPGYRVGVGLENYIRLVRSPAMRGPLISIFVWTFVFAAVSVGSTFLLGLLLAIAGEGIPRGLRKPIRSLLILPAAVPGVIGILVWRGLLNPHVGAVTAAIEALFGAAPPWFSNPMWARSAVLLVNLWLGYPYMMLVCSGALQSIPRELYEAARVDGAGIFSVFRRITLPMILIAAGPVLISSFAMNFNNFNVIYLFNEGGPPIPGTPVPAGHTDILISYTYRVAFASGSGADYGFASAITVVIFAVLFIITLVNYRYTRVWEEVSENA